MGNLKFTIIGVADNSWAYKISDTLKFADKCDIKLVYQPKHFPDLNPIEFI